MTKKAPDKNFMCAIKNTMKNMYQANIDQNFINAINDAVIRTSKIVFHTYNFLNLYFAHLFMNKQPFPFIDQKFILTIMLVVSYRIDN